MFNGEKLLVFFIYVSLRYDIHLKATLQHIFSLLDYSGCMKIIFIQMIQVDNVFSHALKLY